VTVTAKLMMKMMQMQFLRSEGHGAQVLHKSLNMRYAYKSQIINFTTKYDIS
jgi:hypothetical protein